MAREVRVSASNLTAPFSKTASNLYIFPPFCFKNDVQFLRNSNTFFPPSFPSLLSPCREPSAQSDVQKADLAPTVLKNVCATTEANVTRRAASAAVPKVSPAAGVCARGIASRPGRFWSPTWWIRTQLIRSSSHLKPLLALTSRRKSDIELKNSSLFSLNT